MSSLLDFADFGSSFFGSSGKKEKISRREYVTQDIDYYRQGLDTTGIKVDYERDREEDEDGDSRRVVDISQVGMSEGDSDLTPTDISSLGTGFDSLLNSGSSLLELQNNFRDYNTSLQEAGFKDRTDSPMYKTFGLSTAALPQSAKEVKKDLSLKNVLSPKTAIQTIGKVTGLGPATNVLAGFVGGTTVKDPLGNNNYRPSHAVMGLAFDVNMSIQSSNIQQSIQAMNANNLAGYGGAKSPTGFFGYVNGQLVSRSPNGKTYSGVNAEYGRMAEAFSKGYVPSGYNTSTETGTQSIASRTGAFSGYTEKGTFAFGNQTAAAGSMKDVRATAETYFGKGAGREEDKIVISALEKVRSQYTFLGNLKDNVKDPVNLSQVLSEKASSGVYTRGSDLGDAAGSVGSTGDLGGATSAGYSTPSAVASASSFGDDNSSDDSSSGGDSSSMGEDSSGGGYATAKGGFIGKKNFALGGKGEAEPAGFIGGPPEQFNDQTTIADDIPLKVKDGTFVINAPAVEYAGSIDIQKMLSEGYEKAMTRDIGVDKNFRIGKIPSREELDIQISRGEVVVPPHVAKAIGYDRLEKINNRGKREVTRRQKAGDQEKVQAGQGFAAEGGNQKVTIFRGEPYPEQIGDFDKKYMSGRRMTGAWFSSNKNYAKNYGDLQKTLDVTFDEYAKGAKKAEMYRNIASMQSESGSRQLTKDQKKKLFKHVKEIKQFAKMVQEGKADPSRFVNTLHMSIFPDKKDEATIRKIESYKNNPKLFAKLVVRGLANNIVNKGIPVASKVIPGIGALAGFSPKEMGDATLSGKEGFIYNMTPVKDEVTSFAEGGFATGNGVFTIDKVADSYKEKYATPQLARQATMKLAKKMPLADALAILMWGEAKNLGDEGLEGAAHVLINRANAENYPGFGKDIYNEITRTYGKKDKIFEFNAYEPTKFRETIKRFKKDKDTYLRVRNIAEEVMAGARKDFTNNALFFWNPNTSRSSWYKGKVNRKEFKETTRTVNSKDKKVLHVYHVPSDFKMDTKLGTQTISPKQFEPSTQIPNNIPLPMRRPKEVEDRNDDGGGFIDYLRRLF